MGFKNRFKSIFSLDYKYFITELLLIVAGILIALAADSWWQSRQDRQTEQAYLSALKAELEENRVEFENHLQTLNDDVATTHEALNLFKTYPDGNIPVDSLRRHLRPLLTIETIAPSRAALDDIINSGGLQYITSDILRRGIANYEQQFKHNVEMQRSAARLWDGTLSVFTLDNMNLSQMVPPPEPGGMARGMEGDRSLPQLQFSNEFSRASRKAFANRLVQRIMLINRLQDTHRKLIRDIRTLMFQLNIQLGEESGRNTISG